MSNPYMAVAMGQAGCLVRSTTGVLYTAPTGRFWEVIQIINEAKFHTLTNTIGSGDSLANVTAGSAPAIGAGICLYGNFSEFRLHSGIIVAYFGL